MTLQWRVFFIFTGLSLVAMATAASEADPSAQCSSVGCAQGLSMMQLKHDRSSSTIVAEGADDTTTATLLNQIANSFKKGTGATGEEDTGSIQGVQREVMHLARQHIAGQAIDNTTNATLDILKISMENIISSSATAHAADQTAIDNLAADVAACSTVAKDSFENSTHGISLRKSRMVSARTAHATCRTEEATANSTLASSCQAYTNKRKRQGAYASDPTAPDCLSSMTSSTFFAVDETTAKASMEACLSAVAQWSVWLRDLKEKMDLCYNSTAAATSKIADCKANQASFEQDFCIYKQDLDKACDQQENCRALTTATFQNQTVVVKGTEKLRKVQYKMAVTIKCLLDIFRTDGLAAKEALFNSCQSHKNVSTSHLDITYPTVPAAYACTKEANEPCDDDWFQAEYGAQPWGTAVSACQPCPSPVTPAPTPAPQSYPPAGPACYFFDRMFTLLPNARGQLQCRDFDADGDLDCIYSLRRDRTVYYKNTGYPNDPRWVLFGSDCTSWNTHQWKGKPDGCSLAGPESPVHNMIKDPNFMDEFNLACHDFDGDGDYDCLRGSYNPGFKYYRNVGTPSSPQWTEANDVTLPEQWTSDGYRGSCWSPVCVDFDADGDIDCFIGSCHQAWGWFAENVGTPTAPSFQAADPNPFDMLTRDQDGSYGRWDMFDIDGDGDYDLVHAGYTFRVVENTGTPTSPKWAEPKGAAHFPFLKPLDAISSMRWLSPHFLDYDNDGDMDLLIGTQQGPVLQFENVGTKTKPEFQELKGTYDSANGVWRGCASNDQTKA